MLTLLETPVVGPTAIIGLVMSRPEKSVTGKVTRRTHALSRAPWISELHCLAERG